MSRETRQKARIALVLFGMAFAIAVAIKFAAFAEAEKQATAETRAMDSLYAQVFDLCDQVQAAGNCSEWSE